MYKQLAGIIALSCVFAPALADYGYDPVSFLAPEAAGARAIAIGDVTGDGREDVVVLAGGTQAFYQNRVIVYAQAADGFADPVGIDYYPYPTDGYATGAAIELFDLDADGDLDIVLSHGPWDAASLRVLRNDGASFGVLTVSTQELLRVMKFMDVDDDGQTDLVGQDFFGQLWLYPGDGSAGLGAPTGLGDGGFPSPFQLADIDGDGRQDLVYDLWEVIYVRRHEGTFFSPAPRRLLGTGLYSRFEAADFSGDGRADLVLSFDTWPTHATSFQAQGSDGSFRRRIPLGAARGSASSLHAADLDGDGRQDLLTFGYNAGETLGVRLGRGNGGFSAPLWHDIADTIDFALGDINDDGLTDLVMRGENGGVSYRFGRNSAMGADPAVFLGVSPGAMAVRVENRGDTSTSSYDINLYFEPRAGSVQPGDVPADCEIRQVWAGTVELACAMPALAPGAHHERIFPSSIVNATRRTRLMVRASVLYNWPELRQDNNVATKWTIVDPAD